MVRIHLFSRFSTLHYELPTHNKTIFKKVAICKTETKMQNDYALNSIVNAHVNATYIQLLLFHEWFYNLIFQYLLLQFINSCYC